MFRAGTAGATFYKYRYCELYHNSDETARTDEMESAWAVPLFYLPCLAMVLRRPNVGAVPLLVESHVAARLPAWLRGSPRSPTPDVA